LLVVFLLKIIFTVHSKKHALLAVFQELK